MPDTLTIVFSGLMIFHEDKDKNLMEIGIVREPTTHIPRILTLTNSVLANVFDLRERSELADEASRIWRLEVSNPTKAGISIFTSGNDFNRETHEVDRDFRWGMDFEAADFYDRDLSAEMRTDRIRPVLQIPHGEFYTRLKSPPLRRREDAGVPQPFGAIAGVTGCDIVIEGGSASLKAGDTDLFTFKAPDEPLPANTIFEITNTPPDVLIRNEPLHAHGEHGDGEHVHPAAHLDHFQFYYDLLFTPATIPSPRFEFESFEDEDPAPNPRLCGRGFVGVRSTPL